MKYLILSLILLSGCLLDSSADIQIKQMHKILNTLKYEDCVEVVSGFYQGFDGKVTDIDKETIEIQLMHSPKEMEHRIYGLHIWAGNLEKIECKKD